MIDMLLYNPAMHLLMVALAVCLYFVGFAIFGLTMIRVERAWKNWRSRQELKKYETLLSKDEFDT
jgi:hypothetical protein